MDNNASKMGVDTKEDSVDQPIDLSNPRKDSSPSTNRSTFVKKRWLAQASAPKYIPLHHIRNAVKRRAHEMESFTTATTTTTTTSSTTEDSASLLSHSQRHWDNLNLRLDRANSVPYLHSLPPLQRHKSLSESRIAPPRLFAPAALLPVAPLSSTDDKTVRWLLDHQQELQRQRMQQMDMLCASEPSEINLNYYTKMVQFMQTQEALRASAGAVPTVEEDDGYEDNDDDECAELAEIDYSSSPSQADDALIVDEGDGRKKLTRPMTGKHIRTGTGAKPSTLLELRKKIQARQQMKSAALKIQYHIYYVNKVMGQMRV